MRGVAPISDYGVRSGTPVVAYNIYLVPRLELAAPNGHKYHAQPFATADDAVAEATRGRSDRWEVILAKDERIAPNAPNKVTGVNRAPHKR
jgi:hypothetical protein